MLNYTQTTLRLPEELRALLQQEAEKQRRSVHNLILQILWEYFSK